MENNTKKTIYMSVPELAKMLGISRVAVFNRIKKGYIKAHKVGRNYVILKEDISEFNNDNNKLKILTQEKKEEIKRGVEKVVKEYGETLKLLGKE